MHNHRVGLGVVAIAVTLVAVACGSSGSSGGSGNAAKSTSTANVTSSAPPKSGGTLTVGVNAETNGWDPTNSQWAGQGYQVASTILEPLTQFGPDGKPHPYLAQSVTPNSDFTQWTIKLRQGIKFQNGQPFNADAVVLQLQEDKKSALVGQSITAVQSIQKVDDSTVLVKMNRPWAEFPAMIATQMGFMAAPAQLEATGSARTDHPIGTGPYTFSDWQRGSQLTVTKNKDYWQKGVAFPDQITFKVITDPQTMLNSLQSGQIDVDWFDGTATNIQQARSNANLGVAFRDLDVPTMVMLNMGKGVTSNLLVRQALAYATNADEINQRVDQGLSKPADGPYLPTSIWYSPSGYAKPDPAKAEKLLAEYKTQNHITGKVPITLGCVSSTTNDQSMALLKAQWEQVGFKVNRKTLDQATYINQALMGDYEANCWTYLGSQHPDIDAIWMLSRNANPAGQLALNFPRLKDPAVDAAYLKAETTGDQAEQKAQYAIVWKQLAQQLPYLWTGHGFGATIFSKKVHWLSSSKLPDGTPAYTLANVPIAQAPLQQAWVG